MSDPDSGDLLLVAARDAAAFQRLLDRWRTPVYAIFERMLDPTSASECAIGVFVELYHTAGSYKPQTPFPVWLWGIVSRQVQVHPTEALVSIPVQKLLESLAAQTAFLRSAAAALPPGERSAFLLTRIGRVPLPTAAKALGISDDDCRKRLVRAMQHLATALEPIFAANAAGPGRVDSTASGVVPPPLGGPSV